MAYTHTTYLQLRTALANRLGDTGNVYWVDAELKLYCLEAIRTWGLLTGYWRDSGTFNSVASTAFYDISTLTNTSADPLLSYTVTDKDLSTIIQYHLLEPATGSTWTGSEQFTLTDVTNALQQRRDALLVEATPRISSLTAPLPAGAGTVDLSETIILIRRMAWTGAVSGVNWPLYAEDISTQRNFRLDYLTTPGTPQTYSDASTKPIRYVIAPPPSENGTLSMLGVVSGAALNASGISLGIPDDMAWVVKWGALAEMLGREGPGQDLPRSYFCERRWKLGVALAQINPTVVNVEINGVSLSPDAISHLDQYSPNWVTSTGTPIFVGSMRNYIALSPAPNGIYSVLIDVVRKAVVPSADGDFIQIGKEYLDPLLDYAEHLAAFKSGGQEFRLTYRAAENFFNAALSYNQRLAAQHPNILELIRQSTADDYVLPIKKKATDPPLESLTQTTEQSAQLKQLYQS